MRSAFGCIGAWVSIFVALVILPKDIPPIIAIAIVVGGWWLGYIIPKFIEEEKDNERKRREECERKKWEEEFSREKKVKRRIEAQTLTRKYPEATKHYIKQHFGIAKSNISDIDITDEIADVLLSHKYSYEQDEQKHNVSYRLKIEAERAAKIKAVQEAAERKRREEERERLRKQEEIRNLPITLPACVSSWNSHSYSTLKHKYFFNYYTYQIYKDNATSSMWDTWRTVWNFKNDPGKNISYSDHKFAMDQVVGLVENTLRSTFGSKLEHLTLVCLTASTQRKTELRFKEFSERVCTDLNMKNAFPYINVTADGSAKHEGGSGVEGKTYDRAFFYGKFVVLFDDVRTSGTSLENERRILENLGAKVICAITIAQTTH